MDWIKWFKLALAEWLDRCFMVNPFIGLTVLADLSRVVGLNLDQAPHEQYLALVERVRALSREQNISAEFLVVALARHAEDAIAECIARRDEFMQAMANTEAMRDLSNANFAITAMMLRKAWQKKYRSALDDIDRIFMHSLFDHASAGEPYFVALEGALKGLPLDKLLERMSLADSQVLLPEEIAELRRELLGEDD